MKRFLLILTVILLGSTFVSSQKLEKPIHFGDWTVGEDPSEFILHLVLERSEYLLKDNPDGKLIIRICGSDDFSESFVKTTLNPFYLTYFNHFRVIVPDEKIFVANSSKCSEKRGFVFNQYWFFPDKITFEYKEIHPINKVVYRSFYVGDYNYENKRDKSFKEQKAEFQKYIKGFINELNKNRKAEGLILHNSKNKLMKRNIAKVYKSAKDARIDVKRIKELKTLQPDFRLDENDNIDTFMVEDDGGIFPSLAIFYIKN